MIRSMTGFGRGESQMAGGRIQAEIRTVNHRFFEISSRLPDNMLAFEDNLRAEVAKKIKRGKVNLSISFDNYPRKNSPPLVINKELALKYKQLLLDLKHSLKLKDDISFSQIISFPGVIAVEEQEKDGAKLWPYIRSAADKALSSLIKMREEEGRRLVADILKRKILIARHLAVIEQRAKLAGKEYRTKLIKKIKELSSGKVNLDKGRIELEVALFAKNSDISEEITRIKAHLKGFGDALLQKDEVGRKLDFIAQELHREINTTGQKTGDYKISQLAIAIKGEIEKIREQIQNIE